MKRGQSFSSSDGSPSKKILIMSSPEDKAASSNQLFFGYKTVDDKAVTTKILSAPTRSRNHCDACDKPFGSLSGLKGHFSSKEHMNRVGLASKQDPWTS
jgi:hypothetical protein